MDTPLHPFPFHPHLPPPPTKSNCRIHTRFHLPSHFSRHSYFRRRAPSTGNTLGSTAGRSLAESALRQTPHSGPATHSIRPHGPQSSASKPSRNDQNPGRENACSSTSPTSAVFTFNFAILAREKCLLQTRPARSRWRMLVCRFFPHNLILQVDREDP